MTIRNWDAEYKAKYEQRLANQAAGMWNEYAAREEKRRQMRTLPPSKEQRADVPWWWAVVALTVILGLLQLWPNDISPR